MTGADLTHVDTWLFDLDNTLYPLDSGIAAQMDEKITDYMASLTGLDRVEARALQKQYLADYGTTLNGLLLHHQIDPPHYHAFVHDLLLDAIAPSADLRAAVERLPGRRLIFTNADDRHALRVLEHLDLADLFDEVFHIGSAGYVAKPQRAAYDAIVAAHAVTPQTTAFFEDSERNLEPAALMGMTTVLIGAHAAGSTAPFVHHRAEHLAPFLAAARLKDHRPL